MTLMLPNSRDVKNLPQYQQGTVLAAFCFVALLYFTSKHQLRARKQPQGKQRHLLQWRNLKDQLAL